MASQPASGAQVTSPRGAAGGASGCPPLDSRPAKVSLPAFISLGRDPLLSCRPACARCKSERILPPILLSCAAARLLAKTGASSVNEALDAHPRPALDDLKFNSTGSFVCLSCALTLLSVSAEGGASPPLFTCPSCGDPHPAASGLVCSSRIDALFSFLAYIDDAAFAASWISGDLCLRTALTYALERFQAAAAQARAPPPPPAAARPGPRGPAGAGPSSGSGSGPRAAAPSDGSAPAAQPPAPAAAPLAPGEPAAGAKAQGGKKRKEKGAALGPGPAAEEEGEEKEEEGPATGPSRSRAKRAATSTKGPARGESAAEQEEGEDGAEERALERRKTLRPPKPASSPDPRRRRRRPRRRAPAPGRGRALRVGGGSSAGSGGGGGGSSGGGGKGKGKGKAAAAPLAIEAGPEGGGGGGGGSGSEEDGSRAGSPDPRGKELAERWRKALAEAERAEGGADDADELAEGPAGGGGEGEGGLDPESLEAYDFGLEAGIDPGLIGRQIDASPEARAALLNRIEEAGRERIRCIMLIACSVLAVHQAYTERYGRNRRLWGAYRAEHLCAKYDHILQAAGFRLEVSAQKSEIYNDLRALGETLTRFPGLARVCGSGISVVDFVSCLPLLKGCTKEGADQIRERLAEEVQRAKGFVFDGSVLELREAGESDGDGDGDEQSEASGEEGAAEGAGEAGAKGD
eukprot:tig00000923_g5476.t1